MKAFPSVIQYFPEDTNYYEEQGMTLRDYFAAKALHAALTTAEPLNGADLDFIIEASARVAYKVADAMMKAREQ